MNTNYSHVFPAPGARLFFVGIGGIGMSALAQYLLSMGYLVAGSDRGLKDPAKAELYDKLRLQGIRLYEQDGSGVADFSPESFVVSAAVELDKNADIKAAPELPVIHRAYALSQAMGRSGATVLAVAGSCGKSSVTAWLASALRALGRSVALINGGYVIDFLDERYPGNFHASGQSPEFVVAEIDESDQSINEFSPDYGMVLNVGDDHYGREELKQVFANFLGRCKAGALTGRSLKALLPSEKPGCACALFDDDVRTYRPERQGIRFAVENGAIQVLSSQSGRHSACNGTAVFAMLKQIFGKEVPLQKLAEALSPFQGVLQRFEVMTPPEAAVAVVNDYAHNPEKIAAAIATAHDRFGAPVLAFFQPHGFSPLRFMRETLKEQLRTVLEAGDEFVFLPVYYAGGTAAFSPTSREIAEDYAATGMPVGCVDSREEAEKLIRQRKNRIHALLILGARDASLRTWSRNMAIATL